MSQILTAAKRFPPALYLYSFFTTLLSIGGQCLTKHLLVSLIQTYIIYTALHKGPGIHFVMTCLEHTAFLITECATHGFRLIELNLAVVTSWTVFLAFVRARMLFILLRYFPALAPLCHWRNVFPSWIPELITSVAIEVSAETTDTAVVAAGQLDDQFPVPVIANHEAEVCVYHCCASTLKHWHLTVAQFYWEIKTFSIHLMNIHKIVFFSLSLHIYTYLVSKQTNGNLTITCPIWFLTTVMLNP